MFLLEHSFDGHCPLFCLDEMFEVVYLCFLLKLYSRLYPLIFEVKVIFVGVFVCFVAVKFFCHGTLAGFLLYFCLGGVFVSLLQSPGAAFL